MGFPEYEVADSAAGPAPNGRPGAARRPGRRDGPPRVRYLVIAIVLAALAGGVVGGAVAYRVVEDDDASVDPPATTAAAASSDPATQLPALIEEIMPAVVAVEVTASTIDESGRPATQELAGSGFVIDADGLIATNAHVVTDARTITVRFSDGTEVPATIVGVDEGEDLAVLRVDRANLAPLALDDSAKVRVGELVIAAGNALALEGSATVTLGIISALGRTVEFETGTELTDMIQTDAAISSGDSGGPLLSLSGEVVGINTGGAASSEGTVAQNIGFAIPVSRAKAILERIGNLT